MDIKTIATEPFLDQSPGTAGLRKTTKVFMQPHYLENYIQAVFNTLLVSGKSFVIGGDGRYYNAKALEIIVAMGIAAGAKNIYIAKNGYLSTPALSDFILKYELDFGIMLSASHNIGGINGDFGIKLNLSNGAPANMEVTDKICFNAQHVTSFNIYELSKIDITKEHAVKVLDTTIKVRNTITEYADKMELIFDFNYLYDLFHKRGFHIMFDAFNGITGPYAREIFANRLGIDEEFLCNIIPKEDFGGLVPDPNPITAKSFIDKVRTKRNIQLGLACDADGDRNMLFSQTQYLEPSDSLAIVLQHSQLIEYYKDRVYGVARSRVTSRAVDLVAQDMGLPCYSVPTGWKYFSSLLDANKVTFCGEESFGLSSNHSREKDGMWAILFWLSIIAKTNKNLDTLLLDHWSKYGRYYYSRNDFDGLSQETATTIINTLINNTNEYIENHEKDIAGLGVVAIENFRYKDPINGVEVHDGGLIITFTNNAELVVRSSGTSTLGVTLRFYLSQYEKNSNNINQVKHTYLKCLQQAVFTLAGIKMQPSLVI